MSTLARPPGGPGPAARPLAAVKQEKPDSPGLKPEVLAAVPEDVPDLPVELPRALRTVVEKPSVEFQQLIDKLVQQHARELQEALARTPTSSGPPAAHLASAELGLASRDTLGFGNQAMERMLSPMSNASNISQSRRRQCSTGVRVNANMILEAWERQESADDSLLAVEARISSGYRPRPKTTEQVKMSGCEWLRDRCESSAYAACASLLLLANLLWTACTLQVQGHIAAYELGLSPGSVDISADTWNTLLAVGDGGFASLFLMDFLLRAAILRRSFWRSWLNLVDAAVGIMCIVEITWLALEGMPSRDVSFVHLFFVARIARAARLVKETVQFTNLQLLVKCLIASKGMLTWSFMLLAVFQFMAAIFLGLLVEHYLLHDGAAPMPAKEEVFRYYGTFTRTYLTTFEIMFANWAPSCRVLVDNISEWFTVFFLVYRCIFGFAVLNVVSAVFIQQTMKTASSDEELAFRQKEKDIMLYNRKVKKLFQSIDSSGDGNINLEEFEKLVQSPKLRFWMAQLELEYHDLMSLFEFLDNGDGNITLAEFIEGAGRLRGTAKALDIWRMETKIEVLFEEVLKMLSAHGDVTSLPELVETQVSSPMEKVTSVVQDVFNNSAFKHIRTTKTREDLGRSDPEMEI
ncbi:unnamed protein product [Symbiodinium sp. CCMP2592]|nr:unnamed protein product [Symbiodinium sp. CCMP2592]